MGRSRKDGASPPESARRPTATRVCVRSDAPQAQAPSAYPRRKLRPRLDSFDYQGQYAYHVVLLTQARSPRFTDRSLGRLCAGHLRRTAEIMSFRLLAFCFMPDHLHILVLGRDDMADLVRFVQRFKQVTSFEFKRATGCRLWQQSFYDRTLRVEEDLAEVATYILGNPVRAGLVSDGADYPLCGGEYAEGDGTEADGACARGASDRTVGRLAASGGKAPSLRPHDEAPLSGGSHV